jgi:hypothetical protein
MCTPTDFSQSDTLLLLLSLAVHSEIEVKFPRKSARHSQKNTFSICENEQCDHLGIAKRNVCVYVYKGSRFA